MHAAQAAVGPAPARLNGWTESNKDLPTFVVGGTLRGGTSSLYSFLARRPDIGMSRQKEPHFFSFAGVDLSRHGPYEDPSDIVTDLTAYRSLFSHSVAKPVRGECSSSYLYLGECAAPLMRELVPAARLVFVLRDPVTRAYSHYRLQRLYGWEPARTFEEALAREEERIGAGWLFPFHYRAIGRYATQVRHYLKHFQPDQLLFIRFERMVSDWPSVSRELLEFIGADVETQIGPLPRENESGVPRFFPLATVAFGHGRARRLAHRLLPVRELRRLVGQTILRLNKRSGDVIPPREAAMLADLYRPDAERLRDILGFNVTPWFEAWEQASRSYGRREPPVGER